MADSNIVDSKDEHDVDTSIDNVCYDKIYIKQGSAAVELMVGRDGVDSKEQYTATSVDNSCYDKFPSKRKSGKDAAVEESVMMDGSSVDCIKQDKSTSVDNVCYDKIQSKW